MNIDASLYIYLNSKKLDYCIHVYLTCFSLTIDTVLPIIF